MKLLLITALVTVAAAVPRPKQLITPDAAGPAPIIEEPVAIGPAIIDQFEPVAPAPIEVPTAPAPIVPPVAPAPIEVPVAPAPIEIPVAPAPAPLVQLILNINTPSLSPGVSPQPPRPEPVQVVETSPEIPASPVQVVDVAPSPVQIVETAPAPIEPVIVGNPVLPSPVVILPEDLN